MPNYRRLITPGYTYFFTQVTYQRHPWLCTDIGRETLKMGINRVRQNYPFKIDAWVLLPDHIHCIWTLPPGDGDFSVRWRLIKGFVTENCADRLALNLTTTASRKKRQESNLWQRRYWEHLIRDEKDFINHCNYIHNNPVKHGLCQLPTDYQFSTVHRFIANDLYP